MKPLHYFIGRNTTSRNAFYAAVYHDGILIKQWGKGDWTGETGQIRGAGATEQKYMSVVNDKMANGYDTVYSGTFKDWTFSNLSHINTMRKLAEELYATRPQVQPKDKSEPVPVPVPADPPANASRLPRAEVSLTSAKTALRAACDRVLDLTGLAMQGEDVEMIQGHQLLDRELPELRSLLSELESYAESFTDLVTIRLER